MTTNLCDRCQGTGMCALCNGTGKLDKSEVDGAMTFTERVRCSVCGGTGKCLSCQPGGAPPPRRLSGASLRALAPSALLEA